VVDADRYFSPNADGVSDRSRVAFRPADRAYVSVLVRDRDGRAVARRALGVLPARRHVFGWDGRGSSGRILPDAVYRASALPSRRLLSRERCRVGACCPVCAAESALVVACALPSRRLLSRVTTRSLGSRGQVAPTGRRTGVKWRRLGVVRGSSGADWASYGGQVAPTGRRTGGKWRRLGVVRGSTGADSRLGAASREDPSASAGGQTGRAL
jgi:hypothetical protein